jgi:NAD(P)-dependent dehydrogenase (short-subunit alcohol dehydrogenase family)
MGMLDGRVVIVTGGGRGLGRAHCLELAGAGATVVVNDLGVGVRGEAGDDERPPAELVVEEIESAGGSAMADATSVADWDGMEALVARTVERYGALHAVVNNAGMLRDRMLTSLTEDDFDSVIGVHLKGTFALTRHACAHWRERAKAGEAVSGRVVSTTSGAGLWGNVGQTNYAAAKAAIAMFTKTVAVEMERYGVTANCLSPIAATRMTMSTALLAAARDGDDGPEGGWDPLDPANASPVVAWLCSEASGWLTGAVLRVDGSTVSPVEGWTVRPGYSAKGGEALELAEVDHGLRKVFGISPRPLGG